MQITTRTYTAAQLRQSAERVRAFVVDVLVDVEYGETAAGGEVRSYSAVGDAPENTLRVLAVCLGRLGMVTQMERDEYGETVHVNWDQDAWERAWEQ